ncbi:MAG: S-layer homology domain-containing protein [Oscillospiraceae bacterium]|nr:S-layer homology domain-containing protein [Oscillospiraceae bacterium]
MRKFWKAATALALLAALSVPTLAASSPSLNNFKVIAKYAEGKFKDVAPEAWYAQSVATAYELGLVNGVANDEFRPDGELTLAETVALASRICDVYQGGRGSFRQQSPWYEVYVAYAEKAGIVAEGEYADYTAPATRAQFAAIMAKALPPVALEQINRVESLPDVAADAPYAAAVLTLYGAGVLNGNDEYGTFEPDDRILRSEGAAIVTRMVNTTLRSRFVLRTRGEAGNVPLVSPENGDTGVSLTGSIVVIFPEPVMPADGSKLNTTELVRQFSLRRGSLNGEPMPFTAKISDDRCRIEVIPVGKMRGLAQYYFTMYAGFRGDSGQKMGQISIVFTTRAAADAVVITPETNTKNNNISTCPEFKFNNDLTQPDGSELTTAYLSENIHLHLASEKGRILPITAQYNQTTKTIRITPTNLLWDDTTFFVDIPAGTLRSSNGLLERYTLTFTTSTVGSTSKTTFDSARPWLNTLNAQVAGKYADLKFQPNTTTYELEAAVGDEVTISGSATTSGGDVLIAAYHDALECEELQPLTLTKSITFTYHPDDPLSPTHVVLIARPKTGSEKLVTRYVVDLKKKK